MALIKLSFAHGAQKEDCRPRTAEELAKLPPNMRRPMVCARERLPVAVELLLDGAPLYQAVLPPTGLAGDGPSRAYQRFAVPPGQHELTRAPARYRSRRGLRLRAHGRGRARAGAEPGDRLSERDGRLHLPVNAEATSWP
jgi:hypothetical protein